MKKPKKRVICEYSGYGKKDIEHSGSHLKPNDEKVSTTITSLVSFNKVVVEIYEEN